MKLGPLESLTWSSKVMEDKPIPGSLALQILNLVFFIGVVIINILSNVGALPNNNAEVSDRYPTLITPAGWTFSVWGLIYFFVAVFVVYQLFPSRRHDPVIFRGISFWFILSCVFNIVWSFLFAYEEIWASFVLIALLLVSLLVAYYRIGVGRRPGHEVSAQEYLCVHVPFSLYSAWLCVATSVNFAVALKGKSGWDGEPWTESGWAVLVMCVLASVTLTILVSRLDVPFGAVVAWALFGIASEHPNNDAVNITAKVLGAILVAASAVALVFKVFFWRRERVRYQSSETKVLQTKA